MDLQGLRVLVTRPEGQAEGLIAALQQLGAEVIHHPLLAIDTIPVTAVSDRAAANHAEQQRIRDRVLQLDQYDKIVFISTNAVAQGFTWIDQYWPQFPQGPRCYAIGAATAAALAVHECTARYPAQAMHSEALLAMPDFQQLAGQRILIFRGVGGREELASTMRTRGAVVDYCEVYRRRPLTIPAASLQELLSRPVILSVTSVETLQALWQAALQAEVGELVVNRPLLVPGSRVATAAQNLGFASIVQAENAGTTAMCSALQKWLSEMNNNSSETL